MEIVNRADLRFALFLSCGGSLGAPAMARADAATTATTATTTQPALAVEESCLRPVRPLATEGGPCATWSMDPFYAALLKLEGKLEGPPQGSLPGQPQGPLQNQLPVKHESGLGQGLGLVRISHFGDSLTADDHLPSHARDRLQSRFGDGGTGFVFLAQPTRWPQWQSGSRRRATGFALRSIVADGGHDRLYGIGGAAFDGAGTAMVATARDGPGASASHLEVSYLARPQGGTLSLELDGKSLGTVSTAAESPAPGYRRIDATDGPHRLSLTVTRGSIRAFGVTLERDRGVLWENLALISASTFHLAKMDLATWTAHLAHRAADLNIVFLGTNDLDFLDGAHAELHASPALLERYRAMFESLLLAIRTARPAAACLVLGPIELTGYSEGRRRVRATWPSVVEIQRKAARAHGCAYWDTYAWMGGSGSATRWHQRRLLGRDYAHFSSEGGVKLADGLVDSLLAGLNAYRARTEAALKTGSK